MTNDFYGEYYKGLEAVEELLLREIGVMIDSLGADSETSPAEHIKSRIKSPASLVEKLGRLGLPVSAESGLSELSDVIGVRVVTHFIGDIYTLLGLIERDPNWRVFAVKDYIADPKPNGYRSLHVLVTVPFGAGGIDEIRAEIQLRTIAMDCWASLEHQLRYKKDIRNTALLEEELKRCSDEMASTDLTMQTIRDMIRHSGAAGRGEPK